MVSASKIHKVTSTISVTHPSANHSRRCLTWEQAPASLQPIRAEYHAIFKSVAPQSKFQNTDSNMLIKYETFINFINIIEGSYALILFLWVE